MMTTAYSELYLDDAMNNLGDMVDFAVHDLGYEPDEFFNWFISSGIASRFEKGIDINLAEEAVNRACQLIEELGCGTVLNGMLDYYPQKEEVQKI